MMPLLSNYPLAAVETATLLEWAHMGEPPYPEVQAAAPWLEAGDGQ